jgi:predicted NodU family carbamoyl transferase
MRILSINFGHHSSFCTYCDGKVEHFFLTERFTRIKYDENIKLILYNFFNLNLKIDYISITYCNFIDADQKKRKN